MNHAKKPLPHRAHFVGICGVATSALAIALAKAGVIVTGSDKGFFPPVSTSLTEAGVPYYAGWHPEKMFEQGAPDIVVVGTASGSQNPETDNARALGLPIYSFAEAVGQYLVRQNSIVVAGTWGKTSSAALLSHILIEADYDPSYMFGGISLSHDASARHTTSKWSVFEGDEYKSSPTDPTAKFFYYHPSHLLLTAVSWDHADLYPTEAAYFETFQRLLGNVPAKSFVVANKDQPGVTRALEGTSARVIRYGRAPGTEAEYTYDNIRQSRFGLTFNLNHDGKSHEIKTRLLGSFQAENITGCFAMASELGVPTDQIIAAIGSFKGLKRRLEKRLDGDATAAGVTVFDDIAHSPEKASAVLHELHQVYGEHLIAVFEPNIGGRERAAAEKYQGAFHEAETVVIPRLTKLKVANEETSEPPMSGEELAAIIASSHPQTKYIDDDEAVVSFLTTASQKGAVIAFLGSHGFRGMIEETVKRLESKS